MLETNGINNYFKMVFQNDKESIEQTQMSLEQLKEEKSFYVSIYTYYKKILEHFLNEKLPFIKYEEECKQKHLKKLFDTSKNIFLQSSYLDSNYFYLRNPLYLENLTETELKELLEFTKNEESNKEKINSFITRTFKKVLINPYTSIQSSLFFGPITEAFAAQNGSLILGFHCVKEEMGNTDEERTLNQLKQINFLEKLKIDIQREGTKILNIPVICFEYNEYTANYEPGEDDF